MTPQTQTPITDMIPTGSHPVFPAVTKEAKMPDNGAGNGEDKDPKDVPKTEAKAAPKKAAPKKAAKPRPKKTAAAAGDQIDVAVAAIVVDVDANPRKNFDRESLRALASDMKANGQVQPIAVYFDVIDNKHHLIAGERRVRAAKLAGMKMLKAVVLILRANEDDDGDIAQLRFSENLERDALSPLEEARNLQQIIGKKITVGGKRVVATAKIISQTRKKSAAWVSQRLALLDLPKPVQTALDKGELAFSHARELIGLGNVEQQSALFQQIMKGGDPDVAKTKRAVSKARRGAPDTGEAKRGRPVASGEAPSIRQNLDVALERLQSVKVDTRKKQEVREGLATSYEKFDKAKTEDKKVFWKGVITAMEWMAGFREGF